MASVTSMFAFRSVSGELSVDYIFALLYHTVNYNVSTWKAKNKRITFVTKYETEWAYFPWWHADHERMSTLQCL